MTRTVPAQDKALPHSLEAEQAVLGSVLMDPDTYWTAAASGLQPQSFYLHKHRWIWEAFRLLAESTPPVSINIITVAEVLASPSFNQLTEAGGTAYLTEMINSVPTSVHIASYAGIILRAAQKRELIEAAGEAVRLAYSQDDPTQAAATTMRRLSGIAGASTARGGFMRDLVPEHMARLTAVAEHPEQQAFLTTSIPGWDMLCQGFFKSDFDLIAGRPGQGKTALMLQIAGANAAPFNELGLPKTALHVAYFSLEMPREQLISRLMSRYGLVEVQKFRRSQFSEVDWENLYRIEGPLGTFELYIDDTPALSPMQLRATCARLQMEWDLKLAIVDHITLMGGVNQATRENRAQEMTGISSATRSVSLELEIALIAGCQLSRAAKVRADLRPVLTDLRDSGSLEQDATSVTFIHPDPDQHDAGDLIIAKARNGPTGQLRYIFDKPFSRFKEAIVEHIDLSNL